MYILLLLLACSETLFDNLLIEPTGVSNPGNVNDEIQLDIIHQRTMPEVDILFVVDSSGSMVGEQISLANNFPMFMNYFLDSELDYHIGVVTTDVYDRGRLEVSSGERWVQVATAQPYDLFSELADVGILGSGIEAGFDTSFMALTDPVVDGYNSGFRRRDASLHIIVVSDEDDQSVINPNEYLNWLSTQDAVLHGVINDPADCPDPYPSIRYRFTIEASGGAVESICSRDWSGLMDRLGLAASSLRQEFYLTKVPQVDTLRVWTVTDEYTYDLDYVYNPIANSVTTEWLIPQGGVLMAEYTVMQ